MTFQEIALHLEISKLTTLVHDLENKIAQLEEDNLLLKHLIEVQVEHPYLLGETEEYIYSDELNFFDDINDLDLTTMTGPIMIPLYTIH